MDEEIENPDLEDLLWVREQYRTAIPTLSGREMISALEGYRKLIGQIASLKKALNTGESGAAGKLEALVGDAPSGGTEGAWDDPAELSTVYGGPDD
jgi:hypothetical protein